MEYKRGYNCCFFILSFNFFFIIVVKGGDLDVEELLLWFIMKDFKYILYKININ